MKTANNFVKYLVTICLITSSIGCQAYPENDRSSDKKRETLETNVEITENPCKQLSLQSENKDDKEITEQLQSNANDAGEKNDETTTSQVLERPVRNSRHFQHRSNKDENSDDLIMRHSSGHLSSASESPIVGSKGHNKNAKISEMHEQQEQQNFKDELTEFIRSVVEDVSKLMDLAGTIFMNLKSSLIKESENDCNDCLSLLATNSDDFEKTQSMISELLERGFETVDRFVKEPSHRWHKINDIFRSENSDSNIAACVTRVKRRLYKLLALARECANLHDDAKAPTIVDSIKNFISEFDVDALEPLDDLTKYKPSYSSGGSAIRDVSSGASSTRFLSRNYRGVSKSMNRRSLGMYNANNNNVDVSGKATEDMKAFGSLLNFLRSVPTVLSEILRLINSGCTARPLANGNKNHKIASPTYNREGNRRNSYGTSAAHSASGFLVGNPSNVDSSESDSSSFPSPAHEGRRQHSNSYKNKNSEDSETDDDSRRSEESSRSSFYDHDSLQTSKKTPPEPVLGQARNRAHIIAATKGRPSITRNKPSNTPSQKQEPTLGKAHRKPFALRPSESSSVSEGSSRGFSARDMIVSGFPQSSFPQCHYVNTIKYEGPVNTYGGPMLYSPQQYPGLPSFYFNPLATNLNDFNDDDSDDNYSNEFDFSSLFDTDLPNRIPRASALTVPMDQGLILFGSYPIEFGDYVTIDFGKCTLVSKFIEDSDTIDFQLYASPLLFFKRNDYSVGSIWEISTDHFMDVVGSRTFEILDQKCKKISYPSNFHRKTNYRRSTTRRG